MKQLVRFCISPTRVVRIASALGLLAWMLFPRTGAGCTCDPCIRVRPQDEVWVVSTREMGTLPRPALLCDPCFDYHRYCCGCGWVPRTAADYRRSCQPSGITVVYVHGNRMTAERTCHRGLDLYRGLNCCADERPIRFVIWSWPSDPIRCHRAFLRDARVKLRRTPLQSYYLGWWLCDGCRDARVSLMGYSYGGHTILGALHLMGGGSLAGRCLPDCCRCHRPRTRLALLAAASQAGWLLPGGRHDRALGCVEHGIVFYNRKDPVLKCFPRTICIVTGPALGLCGLAYPWCGPAAYARFIQYDVTHCIGRRHQWERYRHCAYTMNKIREFVFSWQHVSAEEERQSKVEPLNPLVLLF
jgi:hypothetical protein